MSDILEIELSPRSKYVDRIWMQYGIPTLQLPLATFHKNVRLHFFGVAGLMTRAVTRWFLKNETIKENDILRVTRNLKRGRKMSLKDY